MPPNKPLTPVASIGLRALAAGMLVAATGAPAQAAPPAAPPSAAPAQCSTLLRGAGGLGYSFHYVPGDAHAMAPVVDAFDAKAIAAQLEGLGAGWLLFTLHHQNWLLMAPSEQFASLVGRRDWMSARDVPLELSEALRPRGIRLFLYVNIRLDPRSAASPAMREALGGWPPTDTLIDRVAAVYRELSLRYGTRVSGWWVDGAWRDEYKLSPQRERWFGRLADALRAGNPEALVAFNPGLGVRRYSTHDSYTAGEIEQLGPRPAAPCVDGAAWHAWTFLGDYWARDGVRFGLPALCAYVREIVAGGGALTLDLGLRGLGGGKSQSAADSRRTRAAIDPAQSALLAGLVKRRVVSGGQSRFVCDP